MPKVLLAAAALVAVTLAVLVATVQKEKPAFPQAKQAELAELERAAAADPDRVPELVAAYLEAQAPGMAAAAVDRALAQGETAELLHLSARVRFHMGKASEALAHERRAEATCARQTSPVCGAVEGRRRVLEELVAAGIEDPIANAEASALAYQRANRGARYSAESF